MTAALDEVRKHGPGSCDQCRNAALLLTPGVLADDAARTAEWDRAWLVTAVFFDTIPARIALARVAGALEERVMLSGAEVEALIDVPTLRAAIGAALAEAAQPETSTMRSEESFQ